MDLSSPTSSQQVPSKKQTSTAEKIAKYTIASSLAGAILTAAYESTIGRARAIRALEANAGSSSSRGNANEHATAPSSGSRVNGRTDAAKFYRHNTPLLSAAAALNSGIVAFAFFSLREHVISPVLSNARNKYASDNSGWGDEKHRPLTWFTMRMYHLEDSALTGALLGGGVNAWMKGPKGIFPGMITASLACSALQFIVNELDVQRIRYISARQSRSSSSISSISDTNSTSVSDSATMGSGAVAPTEADVRPGMGERLLRFIGITKVDDTEYLRRLKAKREKYLERIRELEEAEQSRKLGGEREMGSESAKDARGDRREGGS